MRLSDRITGGFLVVLGSVTAYAGSLLPPVPGQQVGPNVFPLVCGSLIAICGLLIALGIGRTFEDEAEADFSAHVGVIESDLPQTRLYKLRVLIPPALLLFYVLAVDGLGFVPTAAVIAFVIAVTLGANLKLAIPVALLSPVGVHLIFYKLLRVPLPDGLLPMPW
ncbi:MAG: tripartite tricarboxylate transporter TctB family protein [Pseudolabrys sp.]|nr:tripartite tricarboxylate transporter TctB family protein [Pseudolabrys sp.]